MCRCQKPIVVDYVSLNFCSNGAALDCVRFVYMDAHWRAFDNADLADTMRFVSTDQI